MTGPLEEGDLTVPSMRTNFGQVLLHRLEGPILWVVLPSLMGWSGVGREVRLQGQTYLETVREILSPGKERQGGCRPGREDRGGPDGLAPAWTETLSGRVLLSLTPLDHSAKEIS